ncbi:MAG: hypothetical protein KGL39_34655 [Patescibacteria group bacterium]|nr:hypothetical protein [Patescibacteria group bacterium]
MPTGNGTHDNMPPLANRNNNPGDLRFIGQDQGSPGQGGFAEFPTPEDGTAALLNDIQSKINRNPKETIDEFAHTYAPPDDGNDSMQYAADLANQLGVSPKTDIGSLQPKIGEFASAIAKNEGYHSNQPGLGIGQTANQVGQAAGTAYNAVGGAPGAIAIGAGTAGLGALGAGILGEGETLLEGAGNAIGGTLKKAGGLLGSWLGVNNQGESQTTSEQQPTTVDLGSTPQVQNPSQGSSMLSDLLSQTVGGKKIMQEGERRGIDPIAVLEQTGALSQLQPDENGNIDKETPTATLNSFISQDKSAQRQMVGIMTSPTHLDDLQKAAEIEVLNHMGDTGDSQRALKEVQRIFDDYRSEQPTKIDRNGNEYVSNYINPARLQKKKELLSVNERDFALPRHERAVAAHVKEAMRQRLSNIAQQEGVQGWDETNKRMEGMILARKAIEKLKKKAPRDKFKEFKRDLTASLLSGGAARLVGGNPQIAGILGYLIEHNLSRAEYKKLGTSAERKEGEKRAKGKLKPLLSREKPANKVGNADNEGNDQNT